MNDLLAYGLHLRPQNIFRSAKLFEIPFGNFRDHVIDRRFKRRGRLARDVVGNLVECVTNGEFRRDLRDRKSRGFRSQRRGTRDARIHFDDANVAVLRIHAKLNVRAARFDADFANYSDRHVAHQLILAISQRLRGRNRDRVARVYTHRIEVLDRADDHDVVGEVAHYFELKLFPTENRLFDQHFMNRRSREPAANDLFKLFGVVSNAATGAAERKRRANDRGITRSRDDLLRLFPRLRETAARHLQSRLVHRLFEQQTILGDSDRVAIRADHLDIKLAQHARVFERNREIERGL